MPHELGTLAAALFQIGGKAFALMVPVLAGFIASQLPIVRLAPLIGGMLASLCGAGFGRDCGRFSGRLQRTVSGAKYCCQSMEALKPVLVPAPLLSTLITGLIMIYAVGGPVSAVMEGLTTFRGI